MKEIFDAVDGNFLDQNELNSFIQHIMKVMMDSDTRKVETEKAKHEDGIDDDEITMLGEDSSREEDIHLSIAELFGAIFKTHKGLSQSLAENLCAQVIPKALDVNQTEKMHKFGIFLVDDMIEFLGIDLLGNRWEFLANALLTFIISKHATVRQAASYGLGQLAIQSRDYFAPIAESCVNKIYDSLKIPQNMDKPKPFGHSKDNSIAALGKILKNQGEKLANPTQVFGVWLESMPLKFDKMESIGQNEFLADLVNANAPLIVEAAPRAMAILGEILDTKTCSAEIRPKVVEAIKKLATMPNVSGDINNIFGSLSVAQRKKVNDLFVSHG